MDWKKIGIGVFVVDAIVLNLGLGFLLYKSEIRNSKIQTNSNIQNPNTYTFLEVDNKLAKLKQEVLAEVIPAGQSGTPVPSITPVPQIQTVVQTKYVQPPKTRTVAYVTIPGSGQTSQQVWQDLSGTEFYFDKGDYPNLLEVYFEANMRLVNGNGKAYLRIFDITHGIGVQGSDVETTSQTAVIMTSGQVNFWMGKNLYRVQARTLTADTAVFNYGRLKIVTEN